MRQLRFPLLPTWAYVTVVVALAAAGVGGPVVAGLLR
jgi:hypothetical protein